MDKEEKTLDWKTYELNFITWHLIIAFLVTVINILAYHIHLFTYGIDFWYLINHNWNTMMIVNIGIPVCIVIIWDLLNWNYWRFGGIIFVVFYTVYFMMFASLVEDATGIAVLIVGFICMLLCAMAFGKPGGMFDKILDGYLDRKYSDADSEQLSDYDSQIMSLRAYYKGDMEPYEVLYEQVGVMLEHELLDDDVVDILSAKEHDIYDYSEEDITEAFSLSNPKYNPIHSANRFECKEQYYAEVANYINTIFMSDFLRDYHGKKNDKNYKPEGDKEYDIKTVEKVMRMYIEKLEQPELLLKYCVIALYKNTPEYRKFSLMAARTYCAMYIQAGIVGYGDLFVDLMALLNACNITEFEDIDDVVKEPK